MQYLLIQSLNSFSHGKKKVVYNSKEILKTDTFYVQSMYNRFKVALPLAFKIYLLYKISNTVLNLQTHLQVLGYVCSMYALYAYLSSMNHLAYFLHIVYHMPTDDVSLIGHTCTSCAAAILHLYILNIRYKMGM